MRTLVISEPVPVAPQPEMMLHLVEAFRAWRERWASKMEMFEFFAGRPGGWGVFNCDEVELSRAMMEYPMAPFSQISVHPTVDGDEAMARQTDLVKQTLAAMGG